MTVEDLINFMKQLVVTNDTPSVVLLLYSDGSGFFQDGNGDDIYSFNDLRRVTYKNEPFFDED